MTDLENTIKGVHDARRYLEDREWVDKSVGVHIDALNDAIAMLKEQEAVKPYSMNAERTYGICPKCGKIIFRYGNVEENHYCGVCGQAVKWE